MLTDEQIANWRADLEREQADAAWMKKTEGWRDRRNPAVRQALVAHLQAHLGGDITLPDFQTTFDRKTRKEWNAFGLKGPSGAMFLNTLVKHIPDQAAVDVALKEALPVPGDPTEGKAKMAAIVGFIDALTSSGAVAKKHVQSARIPFFLSAWWQAQNPELWSVYYESMRLVFKQRDVWHPNSGNLVDDYFAFHEATRGLQAALGFDAWTLEKLCMWLNPSATSLNPPTPPPPKPATGEPKPVPLPPKQDADHKGSAHTEAQWLLAMLGKRFNCKVWIAQNDRGRTWQGEKLGAYSIPTLPTLGIGDPAQAVVRLIDVIWLKGTSQVVAAFEVEHTTAIYSGLLRMSDLTVLAPNSHFPIYIVAPDAKLDRVREQMKRPTFQHIKLHQRCRFFSMERLIEHAPAMLQWANDPAAIDQLAERISDLDEDAMPVVVDDGSEP